MQKNENFFRKSMVLLIKHFIFAPANGNTLAFLINDLVAQLVEHLPFKERVLGSSPSPVTGITSRLFKKSINVVFMDFFILITFN